MINFDNERRSLRRSRRLLHRDNNVWTGIFLLIVGTAFLLKNMDLDLPHWLFRWESLVFLLGLYIGLKQRFKGAGWFIMIVIAGTSLLDEIFPVFERPQFTWAVVAIIVGFYFIVRPKNMPSASWSECTSKTKPVDDFKTDDVEIYSGNEALEVTAIFGSVKKVVVSKNFRGGEIVSIMGGSDINLSQSDIHGRVALEATNIMGGTKLIIPPTWDVQSEMVAIFGGVEDKRDVHSLKIDPNKVLVLEGTCIFGGLEIRSF